MPWWAAQRVRETRSRSVAVEDTLDLAFYDDLSSECLRASVACLNPRMEVHTNTGLVHVIVIDEDVAALRCIRDHIGREKIVDVNARARDQGPSGSDVLATAKAFFSSRKR